MHFIIIIVSEFTFLYFKTHYTLLIIHRFSLLNIPNEFILYFNL